MLHRGKLVNIFKALSVPALMVSLPACAAAEPQTSDHAGGGFVVYANGAFNWPGDYSYAVKLNYKDTAGKPESGSYDLAVTLTSPWGAWQPFGPNWNFDLKPYKYLQFDLKPSAADQHWECFALMVGDKNITDAAGNPQSVDVTKFGPAPQPGVWATYKIPLTAIMTHKGELLKAMYKFDIQDKTGSGSNVFYVNNVKFTAD